MATFSAETRQTIQNLGDRAASAIAVLGDWSIFSGHAVAWSFRRRPSKRTLQASLYFVGVRSVAVIIVTGLFIGMVMGVEMYSQFSRLGLTTRLGSIINVSVIKELGPVLAATMIAGRVGSAMAAELATMRVTEQIDALSCLGANPIHYLVVPRLLACVLLIPLLTIIADFTGVMGGALISIKVYHVESYYYWVHSRDYVGLWDIGNGLFKSLFFGAAIALISCHRGFNSRAGAEGVGRAATEAFVASFIAILVLDFFLAMFLDGLYAQLWPSSARRLV
ncbi:MAG: ABC transporter permease [Gemmataceae bacterium]|nr:ABC transporter permease [Gemmataceae bacterium]